MDKSDSPTPDMSKMVSQSVEQARGAMEKYLRFLKQSMSALPWGQTELTRSLIGAAERNIAATFEYAEKLTSAKDPKEFMQIQNEFVQAQMAALSNQAREIGETATKEAANVFKETLKSSS